MALQARQLRAVELLVRGNRQSDVAVAIGVTKSTINNWLTRSEEFRQALHDARRELLSQTVGEAVGHLSDAINTLAEIQSNPDSRDTDRIAAAARIIDLCIRASTTLDFDFRLQKLEAALNASGISDHPIRKTLEVEPEPIESE